MNDTEAISVCMLMEENKQLKKDNEKLNEQLKALRNTACTIISDDSKDFQQYTEEIQQLKDNALNEHLMNVALLDANERLKVELEYKSEVLGDLDEENKKLKDIIHEIKNEFEELGSVPWQTNDVFAIALENIDNIINSLGEEKNEEEN